MKYDRITIFIILLVSFLGPLQYALLNYAPPEGLSYNGFGDDDALLLTSLKYAEFNFNSPWILETDRINGEKLDGNIFLNPGNGPVYMMVVISPVFYLSCMDPLSFFVAFKFFSSILLLVCVFYLFNIIINDRKTSKLAFIIFSLSAGFGGILNILYKIIDSGNLLYPSTLFGFGTGAFRIIDSYQAFPLAIGVLSLILFIRKKIFFSSILLALTLLFYPAYAAGSLLVIVIYDLSRKNNTLSSRKNLLKILAVPFSAGLLWIYSYCKQPFFFEVYSFLVETIATNISFSIIVGIGLPIIFAAYYIFRKDIFSKNNYSAKILIVAISFILLTLAQLMHSFWARSYASFEILGSYSLLLYAPFMIILLVTIFKIYKSGDVKDKFLIIWLLALIFVISFPAEISDIIQPKIVPMIYLPSSILAAYGIIAFSNAKKMKPLLLVLIIIIVSLPSIFFYYSFNQAMARSIYDNDDELMAQTFYYTSSDRTAMENMKLFGPGTVLASAETSAYIPLYSGKKAMPWLYGKYYSNSSSLFSLNKEKEYDVSAFFTAGDDEKLGIIKKYNISYIFYGTFERYSYPSFKAPSFLNEIYKNSSVVVYKYPV